MMGGPLAAIARLTLGQQAVIVRV